MNKSGKLPVIIQDMSKTKYVLHLFSGDCTLFDVKRFIFSKISAKEVKNLNLFINKNSIKRFDDCMYKIYAKFKDHDNFLYIFYNTN